MKIGHTAEKTATAAAAQAGTQATATQGQSQAAAATAIPAQADPSARIQLSTTASSLLSGTSTPEFDSEKVARISKQIEDGTFKVNHGAIADKLIANAQEALSKVRS